MSFANVPKKAAAPVPAVAAKKANPKVKRVKAAKKQPKSQAQGIMSQMLDKNC